jgi:hypothetical protein
MTNILSKLFASTHDRLSTLSRPFRLFLSLVAAAVLAFVVIWILNKLVVYFFVRSYINEIADAFGLNQYLVNAIVWITFAIAAILLSYAFSFSKRKRQIGLFGILVLIVGQSLFLWYGMKDHVFNREGKAVKCYIVTRDSIRYGDRPGIDPATGYECREVTPDIAERVTAYENGKRPKRIAEDNQQPFFDQITGNPITWYFKATNGEIEIFDLMGFHPDSGEELLPVMKDIVTSWKTQKGRRIPRRINDPDGYGWFDPLTGKARLWYRRTENTSLEFFDGSSFDPQTGEPLVIVSKEIIDEWHQYSSKQCYIITRDPREPVRYGKEPGIDPATGRQCRVITPEIVERLREYEKGNRPKKITSAEPTFFDLRTGEPIVWYLKTKNSGIDFFDLMGFHPETGEELLPVTKEIVELWNNEKNREAPRRVPDLGKYPPFDPLNGKPRVWYWRGETGDYEFYDSRGFHQPTGEPLTIITKEVIAKYIQETEALQKKREEDRLKREREARERTERMEREKKALAEREDNERRERELKRDRETQAAKLCDQLAANPNDRNRSGDGVPYDTLKTQASQAIESCEIAAKQAPTALRFQYQLARALQSTGKSPMRQKAVGILNKLVEQEYPAAYDNLGYLLGYDQNNFAAAVKLFRTGTKLGDPDSMLSLAEMIEEGRATPMNRGETKIDLYTRAAQLGHPAAIQALQEEREKAIRAERDRALQEEALRRGIEMLGGAFGWRR